MRKIIFIFFFLLLTFFTLKVNSVFAQELTPTQAPINQASPSAPIKYDLAYPGILPDHPLYKLKVLRDRISISLMSDPLKKIEFYLLQTDKGILAAAMLVDKNKIDLAGQTALKAEHNFTLISRTIGSYYRKNPGDSSQVKTKDLVVKLKTASLKHQEVLNSLIKRIPKEQQKNFENVIYFSKSNMKTIEKTIEDYESDKKTKK